MSVLFLEGETQNSCPWGEIVAPISWIECFFQKNYFIYWLRWVFVALGRLFLVVSSCGKWGLPLSVVCGLLTAAAPLVEEHLLGVLGLVAPWHVGPSRTWDWTSVPVLPGRFFNHGTTREAIRIHSYSILFFKGFFFFKQFHWNTIHLS